MTLLCFSSNANEQIQPKAFSSLITDITATPDGLMAVGERGHVFLYQLSQQKSWQQVATPTGAMLTNVFSLDKQNAWAVGHDATIIHSSDSGKTWTTQFTSTDIDKPFLDVLFFNKQHGIAVGAYGLFYRTLDGGKNWASEFHDELLLEEDRVYLNELKQSDPEGYEIEKGSLLPHFNRVLPLKDDRILLIGELGLVAVSNDQGKSFTSTDFPYEGSMFNAIENDNNIYVIGLRGNAFKSEQDLQHWTKVASNSSATLHSAAVVNNKLLFVGNAGEVLTLNHVGKLELVRKQKGINFLTIATDQAGQIWLGGTKGLKKISLNK
ncbi:MAG: WD40/YVTN/BNR-like repeat-containing protein [Parashewanella sp.]